MDKDSGTRGQTNPGKHISIYVHGRMSPSWRHKLSSFSGPTSQQLIRHLSMKKSASVGTVGASTCGHQHLMSRDLEEVSPPVQPVVDRQTLAQTAKQAGASESTPTSLGCGLENLVAWTETHNKRDFVEVQLSQGDCSMPLGVKNTSSATLKKANCSSTPPPPRQHGARLT